MNMMKALSKLKPEVGLWMTEVPIPEIGPDEVLIRIKKTAICGTDLHIYNWDAWAQKTINTPMHIGHEYVGEIAAVGAMVKGLKVGDRVSGEGHITCGQCRNCRGGREHFCPHTIGTGVNRPGAFAEYLAIPARNAFKVPDDISDDLVAFFDPFGNAVHTALSFNLVGEDVLINGAGPIGLMCVAIARFVGARRIVITDIHPYRLKLAEELGADVALNVSGLDPKQGEVAHALRNLMPALKMKEGFDVGLELSGNEGAISSMIDAMSHGSHLALLGLAGKSISIPWDKIVWNGLMLKGIYGREMFETWHKMVALIQSGLDITPILTHRFSVDDYLKGFEVMNSGHCGKVVLDWT